MPTIKVIKPGFQSTIQDLGRFGYSHLGISISGAADSIALRIGNLLIGNAQNTPAIEMTLIGGEFQFDCNTLISITGSDFQPRLNDITIPMWTTIQVKSGDILSLSNTLSGARSYLCVQGGINVPLVLNSYSTHLLTSIGGYNGRSLKQGDIILINEINDGKNFYQLDNDVIDKLYSKREILVTNGTQIKSFTRKSLDIFSSSIFKVNENSNRMGLRLSGAKIERHLTEDITTEGISLGAIQISHDEQPIILFVEHQTTGGYPKIANVISADFHRIGQLKPRDEIKFSFVSIEEAYKLRKEIESLISIDSFIRS